MNACSVVDSAVTCLANVASSLAALPAKTKKALRVSLFRLCAEGSEKQVCYLPFVSPQYTSVHAVQPAENGQG